MIVVIWAPAYIYRFQILVKEKGVFTNVTSPTTKAKLRILFEVAPLALLVGDGVGPVF